MKNTESGFTLIELLTAMVVAGIVMVIIYAAYSIQTKIYTEQDKTADMQQNLRAGMAFLQYETRMAGYNPTGEKDASCGDGGSAAKVAPGVHTATAAAFGFSMDLDGDGKCGTNGENVTYSIYTADGINKLGRKYPGANIEPIAENIVGINFVYIFLPEDPPSWPETDPTSAPADKKERDHIAAVQVSLLARASTQDRKNPLKTTFTVPMPDVTGTSVGTAAPWGEFNDSISRRLLTTTINCRNMGLE